MAGRELADDVVPVGVQVNALDLAARHHDVVHRQVLKFEDGEQHVLVGLGHEHTGLQHQRLEFFGGEFLGGTREFCTATDNTRLRT